MVNAKNTSWSGICMLLLSACGARSVQTSESNTNWLASCDKSADCADGMACECGVCTNNCASEVCPARLECLAECGGSCQKPCEDDADCVELAASAECAGGVCVVAGGLSNSEVGRANGTNSDATGTAEISPSGVGSEFITDPLGSEPVTHDASSAGDDVCRVAYVGYPEGAAVPADGCGQAICRCDASGDLVDCGGPGLPCELSGNGPIAPCDEMFRDGDVRVDPITVHDVVILGNVLTMDVSHSGGCERHDYAVCFERWTEAVQRYQLRLVHDAHDDGCEAALETTLRFDLTPLAEYSMAWTGEQGGAILTQYGVYTFGELTCAQRDDAARATVADALNALDRSCGSDEECASTHLTAECTQECNALSRVDQSSSLERLLDVLEAGACAGFLDQGCTPTLPVCESRASVCRGGECQLADP